MTWLDAWRIGFAPQYSLAGLRSLREALEAGDNRLRIEATTYPQLTFHEENAGLPCEGACPAAWEGWQGQGLTTIGQVRDAFNRMLAEADRRLGGVGRCARFLDGWDDPRQGSEVARLQLLGEVEAELVRRESEAAGAVRVPG